MMQDFEEVPADASELVAAVDAALAEDDFEEAIRAATDARTKFKGAANSKGEAAALRAICRANCASVPPRANATQEALQAAEEAVALSKKAGSELGEAAGMSQLAKAHLLGRRTQEALRVAEEALAKFQGLSSELGEASALSTLAKIYYRLERHQKALEQAEKSVEILRKLSDSNAEATALRVQFDICLAMKKYSAALQATDRMLENYQASGDVLGQATAKLLTAEVHVAGEEGREAAEVSQEAAQLFKKVGSSKKMARALLLGAEAAMSAETGEQAIELAERAQMILQQSGDKYGQAAAMVTAANLYNALGEFGKATYRAEAAADIYKKLKALPEAGAAMRTASIVFLDKKQYDPDATRGVTADAVRTAKASLKFYDDAAESESSNYAGSLQTLAAAHLANDEYDKAMERATESKALFQKLEHPVGQASALNVIAQVHHKKGDSFEAVSAAKEAEELFREGGDDQGADVAAYLIETFEAVPEKEAIKEEGEGEEKKKEKTKPAAVKSRSGLGDLIPGNPGAVTIIAAYEGYEGRAATTPGQRRKASEAPGAAAAIEEGFQAPAAAEAVFSLRWIPAKPREAEEPRSKRSGKKLANRVVRVQIESQPEGAPGGLVPIVEHAGMAQQGGMPRARDLTALD